MKIILSLITLFGINFNLIGQSIDYKQFVGESVNGIINSELKNSHIHFYKTQDNLFELSGDTTNFTKIVKSSSEHYVLNQFVNSDFFKINRKSTLVFLHKLTCNYNRKEISIIKYASKKDSILSIPETIILEKKGLKWVKFNEKGLEEIAELIRNIKTKTLYNIMWNATNQLKEFQEENNFNDESGSKNISKIINFYKNAKNNPNIYNEYFSGKPIIVKKQHQE